MEYKYTKKISRDEADKISVLLNIDDISEECIDDNDAELKEKLGITSFEEVGAVCDDVRTLATVRFLDGFFMEIRLCSGNTNYWMDILFGDEKCPSVLDPEFDFDDVEIEENGNKYIFHWNIEEE